MDFLPENPTCRKIFYSMRPLKISPLGEASQYMSPPVHIASFSVCLSVSHWKIIHISESIIGIPPPNFSPEEGLCNFFSLSVPLKFFSPGEGPPNFFVFFPHFLRPSLPQIINGRPLSCVLAPQNSCCSPCIRPINVLFSCYFSILDTTRNPRPGEVDGKGKNSFIILSLHC